MPELSPVSFFGWEGSPTKIDVQKNVGTLLLTSLLEDLVFENASGPLIAASQLLPLWLFKGGSLG